MAQPWRRQFRRPDLDAWVLNTRGQLLAASLTLGRAWFARCCPDGGAPQWGSYQRWATTLSGILTTAEVHGFLGNLQGLYETADVETAGWQRVLGYRHEQFGETPRRVSELALALFQAHDLDLPPSIASALGYAPDLGTRHARLAAKNPSRPRPPLRRHRPTDRTRRHPWAQQERAVAGHPRASPNASSSDGASDETWRSR